MPLLRINCNNSSTEEGTDIRHRIKNGDRNAERVLRRGVIFPRNTRTVSARTQIGGSVGKRSGRTRPQGRRVCQAREPKYAATAAMRTPSHTLRTSGSLFVT